MTAEDWAHADACGRELRVACARLRALRMSHEQIAAELHTLPEVVALVLNDARPLRKCGP